MLKSYAGAALTAHLASPISTNALVIAADALTGWPTGSGGPFSAIIDKGLAGLEEKVLCTSQAGGNIVVAIRGYDGTTAVGHDAGATLQHVGTSLDLAEANAHVNATTGVHGLNAGDGVVGRSTPATLTGKVMDGALNSFLNIPTSAVPAFVSAVAGLNADVLALSAQLAAAAVVPAGAIVPFGGSAAPSGYLLCDGTAVSRTTYATLFAVLGTTYGVGNGTTTFTLPDLRGKFPLGSSGSHARGTSGGSETTTLAETNLASHTHGLSGLTAATGGAHEHTLSINPGSSRSFVYDVAARAIYASGGSNGALYGSSSAVDTHIHTGTALTDAGHSHTVSGTASAAGSGTPATTISPYQTVNYLVKT